VILRGLCSVGFSRGFFLLALSHALLSQGAFAGIRPSFGLDHSAWRSTNIVSVLSTRQDGVFEVAESWKGGLSPGDQVTVPELAPDTDAIPIAEYPKGTTPFYNLSGPYVQIPRQPPGSRIVLFLTRVGSEPRPKWGPSNLFEDFKTSAVWIDGGQVYAFMQIINPGPSVLTTLRMSEAKLRDRVAEITGIQADWNLPR
jgi:hypothetical protein